MIPFWCHQSVVSTEAGNPYGTPVFLTVLSKKKMMTSGEIETGGAF
jgi:hypothetical protein